MTSNRMAGWTLLGLLPVLAIAVGLVVASGQGADYAKAVTARTPDNLIAIAALGDTWPRLMALFAALIVIMAVGLGLLTLGLFRAGSRGLAPSGFVLFAIGAVLVLAWLMFEGTVTVWAAQEITRTSAVPPLYEPLVRWAEVMFVIFMLVAYLAIAAFGGAMLATRVAPLWAGWASLLLGGLGTFARLSDLTALGVPAWLPDEVPAWFLAGVPGWIPFWGLAVGLALVSSGQDSRAAPYPELDGADYAGDR
jgi:hypothetical protein